MQQDLPQPKKKIFGDSHEIEIKEGFASCSWTWRMLINAETENILVQGSALQRKTKMCLFDIFINKYSDSKSWVK